MYFFGKVTKLNLKNNVIRLIISIYLFYGHFEAFFVIIGHIWHNYSLRIQR